MRRLVALVMLAVCFSFFPGKASAGDPVSCNTKVAPKTYSAFATLTPWQPWNYPNLDERLSYVKCQKPEAIVWFQAETTSNSTTGASSLAAMTIKGPAHANAPAAAIAVKNILAVRRQADLDPTMSGCTNCAVLWASDWDTYFPPSGTTGCIAAGSGGDGTGPNECGSLLFHFSGGYDTAPPSDPTIPTWGAVAVINTTSEPGVIPGTIRYRATSILNHFDVPKPDHYIVSRPVCQEGWEPALGIDANSENVYACFLSVAAARADGFSGLDANLEGCGAGCNPVNLSSGSKLDQVVDYKNNSPFPIVWERYYHSSLGAWKFSYERNLRAWDDTINNVKRMVMNRPDGTRLTFVHSGALSNAWEADMEANETIKATLRNVVSGSSIVGYEYQNLLDETEHYDANGRLEAITSREGHALTFSYDVDGNLETVEDDFGRELTITRSPANVFGVSWIIAVDDGDRMITYDQAMAQGDGASYLRVLLNEVEYPDATTIEYKYDEGGVSGTGLLTGIVDQANVRRATYTYDYRGRVTSSVHDPDGTPNNEIEYEYDVNVGMGGYATKVTWDGNESYAGTNPKNSGIPKLSGFDHPCLVCAGGDKASITYDAKGNPTAFTDFEGMTSNTTYDTNRGLITSITEAVGTAGERTVETTWHSDFRLPLTVVEPVVVASSNQTRTTTYTYNGNNQIATKAVSHDAGGGSARTWTYTYNAQKLLETETTPLSRTTTFDYDINGNLISAEDPEGLETTYGGYTQDGHPGYMVAPNGLKTKLTYDDMRRVTKVERGSAGTHWETTNIAYTVHGDVERIDLPNGYWLEYTYDNLRRVTQVEDPTGTQITNYDNYGRVEDTGTQVKGVSGWWAFQKIFTYDRDNNVTQITGPQFNSEYAYDDEGRQTQATDNYQATATQNTYDALGRLTTFLDENSGSYTLAYNKQDQVATATDSRGNTTGYSYDGFGNLAGISSPDAGSQSFTTNAEGEVAFKIDGRGATTSITRDDLGRPTQIVYSDSTAYGSAGFKSGTETQTFTYDVCTNGAGKLCSMTDASGTTEYAYDLWGRITHKNFEPAGTLLSLDVVYGYDSDGELSSITYPSGKVLNISNTNGDQTSLTYDGYNILNSATYMPFHGRSTGWDWGGGTGSQGYVYKSGGHLGEMTGNTIKEFWNEGEGRQALTFDANRSDNDNYIGYGVRDTVDYAEFILTPPLSFTYDENNNRTSKEADWGSVVTTYQIGTGNNRIESFGLGGMSPSELWDYDSGGNLISEQGATYLYDTKNRMAQANVGGQVMTYAYNAHGQRMRKTRTLGGNAGTDYFIYDETGRILGVYDENGDAREELVWFDGWRPVATIRGSSVAPDIYRITSDELGTPISVMDDNGIMVWEWDGREPFGFQFPNQDVDGDSNYFILNLRFPGQWADMETALYHNGFRDYHPKTGRYIQSDPIGLEGGWNTYVYAGNNPVNYVDPYGLKFDASFHTQETLQSFIYLSKSAEARRILDAVAIDSRSVKLKITQGKSQFDPDSLTVLWNPREAIFCASEGKGVSPAMALLHELDHFLQSGSPISYYINRRIEEPSIGYDAQGRPSNRNERLTLSREQIAAKELGELVRDSHYQIPKPGYQVRETIHVFSPIQSRP